MAIILLIIFLFTFTPSQEAKSVQQIQEINTQDSDSPPLKCGEQSATERESLISEAMKSQYTIRLVEFIGDAHTQDRVLRQRMPLLTEGDLFTREKLIKSLASVSRLSKIIYPVKLSDVAIGLDRQHKEADMIICFKEKRRVYHGARRKHVSELLFRPTRKLVQKES